MRKGTSLLLGGILLDSLSSCAARRVPSQDVGKEIEISDVIHKVRDELLEAHAKTMNEGKTPIFTPKEFELELHVGVRKATSAQGGLKVWVVQAGGSVSSTNEQIQTIRLKFTIDPKIQPGK